MRAWILTTVSMALLVACGGDTTVDGTTGTGGSGAAGASGATGGSGGEGGVGGTGGAGASGAGGSGGGSGMVCGGIVGDTCPGGEVCDYPDDLCGGADGQGLCIALPVACTEELDPVCACDGMIYDNPCMALAAGTDVSNLGGCPVMPGFFECGPKQCNAASEYCQHTTSDVANQPDSWICMPFDPNSCAVAVPTCMCVTTETQACGGTCEDGDGGVTVHCPGG